MHLGKHFHEKAPDMRLILLLLLLFSLVTLVLATGLGPVSVSPETTARILLSRILGIGSSITPDWEQLDQNIVLGLRLPRVCLGMVVGASLSVCGVCMQALVRNSLADPFILGVSSGASAFATLVGPFPFSGSTPFPSAPLSALPSPSSLSTGSPGSGAGSTSPSCFYPVWRSP